MLDECAALRTTLAGLDNLVMMMGRSMTAYHVCAQMQGWES
jgi:hypothetical protein